MIIPLDKEYQLTKLIKQGKATMNGDFIPLAHWIECEFEVKIMNILYDTDTINKRRTSRLEIIFEFLSDKNKFQDSWTSSYINDYSKKSDMIIEQFKKTLQDQCLIKSNRFLNFLLKKNLKYKTDNLFVVYSAFEPIARAEANESVPRLEIEEFQKHLENKDIWYIITFNSAAIFFFFTDEQVQESETNGIKEELSKKYFDLLTRYDEFGYFKKDDYSVSLDSKENFDNKYQGSWFNYFH